MKYAQVTEEKIRELLTSETFNPSIQTELEYIIGLRRKYSPLSDILSILKREGKSLTFITFKKSGFQFLPLRNVIRVLLKLSSVESSHLYKKIEIYGMEIGCDYFKGKCCIYLEESCIKINYLWRWTGFEGDIHYDKFINFETIEISLEN